MTLLPLLIAYAYRPFLTPIPAWDYRYILLIPLCAGVAVVWKATKCASLAELPKQSIVLLLWILLTFLAIAVGLGVLVNLLER